MYKSPQSEKFSGVRNIAPTVAMAVSVIDNATFALAVALIKLEIFPPGQAATKIIPKATVAVRSKLITNKKVKTGKRINCVTNPVITDLGLLSTILKCEKLISRAMPNMINARAIFRVWMPPSVKFRRILSRTSNELGMLAKIITSSKVEKHLHFDLVKEKRR